MSGKIDEAIAKITAECQGKDYLIPFEEYLTSVCTTDSIAEKILQSDKTLQKCFDAMRSEAKKRAVNGCAYIPPEEGFEIIRSYYGISLQRQPAGNVIDITDLL